MDLDNPALAFPSTIPNPVDVKSRYSMLRDTRGENRDMHYAIAVPTSWKQLDIPPGELSETSRAATLGVFRSAPDPTAEIQVDAVWSKREIEPSDWLRIALQKRGQEIIHSRTWLTPGGEAIDALTRIEKNGQVIIRRWTAAKNGNVLMICEARCEQKNYLLHVENFQVSVNNARFVHPAQWPLSEQLATFARAEPGDFLLYYPTSWKLQLDPESGEKGLSANLLNVQEQLVVGTILFSVLPGTVSPDSVRERLWPDLQETGYSGPLDPFLEVSGRPGLPQRFGFVSEVLRHKVPHELRMSVGSTRGATYCLAVAGPSRGTDPFLWAMNKRAYTLAINQLQTSPPKQ